MECEPSSDSTRVPVEDYMQATTSALKEPTCYEVETLASIAGWELGKWCKLGYTNLIICFSDFPGQNFPE